MTDKEYFKKSILQITSKPELDAFIAEYSLANFNNTLNELGTEDRSLVLGRIESIRITGLYNGHLENSKTSRTVNFRDNISKTTT